METGIKQSTFIGLRHARPYTFCCRDIDMVQCLIIDLDNTHVQWPDLWGMGGEGYENASCFIQEDLCREQAKQHTVMPRSCMPTTICGY